MEATTILVNNREARVNNIGLGRQKTESGKVLQQEHATITLLPGWNPVDAKLWEEAKKNPIVKDHYIAKGILEEKALGPDEIKSLGEDEALRFVQTTWSEDLLSRMRAAESRGAVLAAINAQIATLAPAPKAAPAQAPAKK